MDVTDVTDVPVSHAGLELSALAAATPVLIYLVVIWWFDRYEREPWWLVLLTFLYGAIGAIVLGIALSASVLIAAGSDDISFGASVVAPLCEEPSKALIVYLLLLSRHFDNTTDGLIYGAASGLGFAMTENFLYFVQTDELGGIDEWQKLVILRSLFSALMHCAATAVFGMILGRFRYRGGTLQWLVAPLIGLAIAMAMHATFNNALEQASMQDDEGLVYIAFGLIPIASLTLFSITMISLSREHRMLAAELRDEAALGIIPIAHADILPFHRKRWRSGWLDPRIDKKRYIQAATLLAFRKWQSKLPAGRRHDVAYELVALRKEVAMLLRTAAPMGPPPGMPPPPGRPAWPPPN